MLIPYYTVSGNENSHEQEEVIESTTGNDIADPIFQILNYNSYSSSY